jgi:uncharacterized membrane protein
VIARAVDRRHGRALFHLSERRYRRQFIDQVKGAVTEGTSALFDVLERGRDQIQRRFIGTNPVLIATNPGPDQEARLREVFGQE